MALITFKDLPDTSTALNASNLNNNFNEVKNSNLFTTEGNTSNKYLTSDGQINSNNAWNITDFISIINDKEYFINIISGNVPALCFYDSSKNYISGISYENRTNFTFTAPSNAKYIKISYSNTYVNNIIIKINNSNEIYSSSEIKIGTWIDGKPLYRKVISGTLNDVTTAGTNVNSDVAINVDNRNITIIENAFVVASNRWWTLPFISNTGYVTIAFVSSGGNAIRFRSNDTTYNGAACYCSVIYTKTTD